MKKIMSVIMCFALMLAILPVGTGSAESIKKRPSYLFAIDAGHGGTTHFDPGSTRIDGKYECYDTEKVANEVIKLLNEQGQQTFLIDRNLVTHDRPIQANSKNANFLISLHRDHSSSSSAKGINVYTHDPSHYQRRHQKDKDYAPAEQTDKHELDEELVNNLKTYLTGATAMTFSGIHYGSASAPTWEDYFINRLSNMPSCIIELGFGSNANDNKIFDNNYKTLALAIVKALLATVDLDYIGPFTASGKAVCQFKNEWYYVVNGVVAWNYTGTAQYGGKTYYIQNGYVSNIAVGKTGQCDWKLDSTDLSVTGKGAMANYTALSAVPWSNTPTIAKIESGVTSIGDYSFNNCNNLTEISIPKTVTSIGSYAFNGCTALERVFYYGTKAEWDKISKGDNNSLLYNAQILYICDINGHKYDFVCDSECNVCGEKREVTHTYSYVCDVSCNVCGEIRETEHTYSGICDTVCDICRYKRHVDVEHNFNEDGICTVCGSSKILPGDFNEDEKVTDADAVYLLMYTFFPEDYPINQPCDFNKDSKETDADAVYLLMYTFFPEDYPI